VAEFMQESIVFLVRVQCRRKESSRSLSHLLMSFLSSYGAVLVILSLLTVMVPLVLPDLCECRHKS